MRSGELSSSCCLLLYSIACAVPLATTIHILSFTNCRDQLANTPVLLRGKACPGSIDSQGLLGKKAGVELLPRNLARPTRGASQGPPPRPSLPLASDSSTAFIALLNTNRPCSPIIILVTGLLNEYSTGILCSSDTSSASTLHASSGSRSKEAHSLIDSASLQREPAATLRSL